MDQKQRLRNIIEVCEINSCDNEKWIRSLNTLINNFDQMIEQEKQEKEEVLKKIIELEKLQKDYVSAFNVNMKRKYGYVDHIKTAIEHQKLIQDIVKNTDNEIQTKLA